MTYTSDSKFFCINCGNEGIPIPRKMSLKKEKFHRKALYCLHCRVVCNHIECHSQVEIDEFKENFSNGVYEEDAKESIAHCNK